MQRTHFTMAMRWSIDITTPLTFARWEAGAGIYQVVISKQPWHEIFQSHLLRICWEDRGWSRHEWRVHMDIALYLRGALRGNPQMKLKNTELWRVDCISNIICCDRINLINFKAKIWCKQQNFLPRTFAVCTPFNSSSSFLTFGQSPCFLEIDT